MTDRKLSTGDAAKLLRVSDETVRRLIARGILPATQLYERAYYQIEYDDLKEYADSRGIILAEEEQK